MYTMFAGYYSVTVSLVVQSSSPVQWSSPVNSYTPAIANSWFTTKLLFSSEQARSAAAEDG